MLNQAGFDSFTCCYYFQKNEKVNNNFCRIIFMLYLSHTGAASEGARTRQRNQGSFMGC